MRNRGLALVVATYLGGVGCAHRAEPAEATPMPVAAAVAKPPVPVTLPRSIEAADLDRTVDPCTDFYAYANGAWRAAHPIPDGQARWSRRAVTRDANRQQVRELLGELAAKAEWPAGSTEQLGGDPFAARRAAAGRAARGWRQRR